MRFKEYLEKTLEADGDEPELDGEYPDKDDVESIGDMDVSGAEEDVESIDYYEDLNDAAKYDERLADGDTMIWYMKPEVFRDFAMGYRWLSKKGKLPETPYDIQDTHVMLGTIVETDKETIFSLMQGQKWSPNGEARKLIKGLGLKHTSMSVGDIIQIGLNMYMVDSFGFKLIDPNDNGTVDPRDDDEDF